jgi:CRISPR-associated protein Cmr1
MPRTPPTIAPPDLSLHPPHHWTVRLKTITPMFGGSAETRQVDANNPVRAASVRGHLRFWWRATAGAGCKTQQKLFEAESEIWGNTEKHGRVRVEVVEQTAESARVPQLPRELGYATFPFQEQRPNRDNPHGVQAAKATSVEFALRISCPADLRPQLETALHAWVLFGGVGARTRRGCGSLQMVGDEVQRPKAPDESADMLTALPKSYFVGEPQKDGVTAWKEAVEVYKEFRQGVGFARNPGQQGNRPGRSRYPEPDTLREITRRFGHQVIHPVRGFPRADLGLPIIFHFQGQDEPGDQTLQGQRDGKQRFASPIITKAAVIGGQFVPMVLVLDSPHVWENNVVELKGQREVGADEINLPRDRLSEIPPLNGLPVREAFKEFVRDSGFNEVSP